MPTAIYGQVLNEFSVRDHEVSGSIQTPFKGEALLDFRQEHAGMTIWVFQAFW